MERGARSRKHGAKSQMISSLRLPLTLQIAKVHIRNLRYSKLLSAIRSQSPGKQKAEVRISCSQTFCFHVSRKLLAPCSLLDLNSKPGVIMPLPPPIVEDGNFLRRYLHLFRKRRWMIISVFLIVVATGTIRAFLQTPIYRG